jgi:hypothetical protein
VGRTPARQVLFEAGAMNELTGVLTFLAVALLASVHLTRGMRVHDVSPYEIKHGNYLVMQLSWLRVIRDLLRTCIFELRQVKFQYHAFISFRTVPDGPRAAEITRALRAQGLKVMFQEERLERKELSMNVGRDIGISHYLRNGLLQSSAVVLVASESTFCSRWVIEEFALAMWASSLVVIVVVDGSRPETILPFRSLAFRWLPSSPVYVIHAGSGDERYMTGITRVVNSCPVGRGRSYNDFLAAGAASLVTLAAVLVTLLVGGWVIPVTQFPGLLFYFGVVLCAALVVPCRAKPKRKMLAQQGFQRLIRGWNTDAYRLNGMIVLPLSFCLLGALFTGWVEFVLMFLWFIIYPAFTSIPYWIQTLVLSRFVPELED